MVKTRRLPPPLYVAVLVSLTVFLAVLVITRQPITGYMAETTLTGTVVSPHGRQGIDSGQPGPLAEKLADPIRRQVLDAANLAAAVERAQLSAGNDWDLNQLADQVQVRVATSGPDQLVVGIEVQGSTPAGSLVLVEQLARQLTSFQPNGELDGPAAKSPASQWQIDEARHYERRALTELESLLEGRFFAGREPQPDTADAVNEGGDQLRVMNPQWQQLQNQLTEHTEELDALFGQQFTPQHPMVRDLIARMDTIKERLADTPRWIDRSAAPGATSIASDIDKATLAQLEPLWLSYREASDRRQALERTLADQGRQGPSTMRLIWAIQPAEIRDHLGGRPAASKILLLGLLAAAAGLAAAWFARSLRPLHAFATVQQVADELPIPVIGELVLADVQDRGQRLHRRGRWLQWGTTGSELALGAVVVVLLIAAIGSSSFSAQFTQDPFGSLTEAVVRVGRFR